MRLLVDSHVSLWALDQPNQLSGRARTALQDPTTQLIVSAATVWEIAIKVGLGKLSLSLPYKQWMNRAIGDLGVSLLPITVDYADRQASLPAHHRDPFDRLLVAQSLAESMPVVSSDAQLDAYGIVRIW